MGNIKITVEGGGAFQFNDEEDMDALLLEAGKVSDAINAGADPAKLTIAEKLVKALYDAVSQPEPVTGWYTATRASDNQHVILRRRSDADKLRWMCFRDDGSYTPLTWAETAADFYALTLLL